MSTALSQALEYGEQIWIFPLGKCSPSDDPDKQSAYLYAFRDLAKQFVASARRIGDATLSEMLSKIDTSPDYITEAYDLWAELKGTIDYLREAAQVPNYEADATNNGTFLSADILDALRAARSKTFDTAKLVRYCEELNDAYGRANYISCALLVRAVMNHVPPVFGVQTFSEIVAGAGRSVKAVLTTLNDQARPIADLHSHLQMRKAEPLPTKYQIEPQKASFEILIQEILVKIGDDSAVPECK